MNSERELSWLRRARDLARTLRTVADPNQLLPALIRAAIELTEAERGFIVRVSIVGEAREVKPIVALGFDGQSLSGKQGRVSRTIVDRVLDQDRSVVTSREDDEDLLEATSVLRSRVRSVVAVPLRLRGATCGVLYLDNRFDRQAFQEDDLPCLEAFADHAALALETAALLAARDAQSERLTEVKAQLDAVRTAPAPNAGSPLPSAATCPRVFGLVGASDAIRQVASQVERLGRSDRPALIVGEAGSGRTHVATAIHALSARREGTLERVRLESIEPRDHPRALFGEPTLIGTVEPGALERVTGTLLLSGVERLTGALQHRLLRALETGSFTPRNSAEVRRVGCRLLIAVDRDPDLLCAQGTLREDLACLLDLERLELPPLRDRIEDVPALLSDLLARRCDRAYTFGPGALEAIRARAWGGNLRELESVAERAATRTDPVVAVDDLPIQGALEPSLGLQQTRDDLIQQALAETNGNKSAAAKRLGIPRSTLYRWLAETDPVE